MVTRSKKWKTMISFAAFAVGVSLLLQCGCSLAYRVSAGNGIGELTRDYQETEQFRGYMEEYLSDFLALATGGTVGWYNGYYSGWYDGEVWEGGYGYSNTVSAAVDTAVSVQAEDTTNAAPVTDYQDTIAGEASFAEGGLSEEEKEKQKEQWNRNFLEAAEQDKNLLYRVSYDGKELYSNMREVNWNEPGETLPEGYNFLLYFDGEKVTIQKDGVELDIYGDGYYRDGADWYVPGYKNFTADEKMKKARVAMLAAEVPVRYSAAKYGESGYTSMENRLYYIAENAKETYRTIRREIAGLVLGLACMLLYLVFRKDKRRADRFLGNVTGKIWFEWKVFILITVLALVVAAAVRNYRYYGSDIVTELYYEMEYGGGVSTYLTGQLAREILGFFAGTAGFWTTAFWISYLCVNDIRQNKERFWDGLVSRFAERFETKNCKLNFTGRMVRRFSLVFFISLAVFIVMMLLLYFMCWYITNDAVPLICLGCSILLLLAAFLGVSYWYLTRTKRQTKELELLAEQIQAIHDGDYSSGQELPGGSELRELSAQLADIRQGMEAAIEERMKSEHMKVELVANVSHDIKTPLTSIISYVQFLKQEEELPDHVKDYIRILDEKSERLNHMVQDVFAVSKAASGQLPVRMERLDFCKLLRQTLADMEEQISSASVTMKVEIPEHEVLIQADGERMYRVFQNLIVNALKYSLEGSRVFLKLKEDHDCARASIKNISRHELPSGKDFTGRFVRGDESRTDGGSGLGLSIAKSFTEACGGSFLLETDADLFVVEITFPKPQEKVSI